MNIENRVRKEVFILKNIVLFKYKRLRKTSLTDFILRNNELREEARIQGGGGGGEGEGTTGRTNRGGTHLPGKLRHAIF